MLKLGKTHVLSFRLVEPIDRIVIDLLPFGSATVVVCMATGNVKLVQEEGVVGEVGFVVTQ